MPKINNFGSATQHETVEKQATLGREGVGRLSEGEPQKCYYQLIRHQHKTFILGVYNKRQNRKLLIKNMWILTAIWPAGS